MRLPMTRPNRHRVQRQIVELAIGDSAEGLAVHRELARPFWDRAVPELEEVFDSAAGPHELMRLDRLELDLGMIDGADWPIEFRKKLVAEFARSLAQFTAVSEAGDGTTPRDPQRIEPWQALLFFLVHGHLPWWAARPDDGWTEALLHGLDAASWSALRETVRSDPRARVRLVHSVADEFLDAAVANWSGLRHAARVFRQLTPKGLRGDQRQRWRRGFWSLVLDWVSAGGFRLPRGGPQLVGDLLTLRRTYVSDSEQSELFQPSRDGSEHGDLIRTARDGDLPEPWHDWHLSQRDAAESPRDVTEARADAGTVTGRATASSPSRERAASDKTVRRPVEEEAIYLDGAGAILLHPFFEQLFRERGLLAGRNFRDAEARDRAVNLLGLLTFGSVDVREYDLVLAKVLCGAAVEEPLEPVPLENDDLAACDALLRAVLEHWTALRSSSPEWLRQQFLLREGKLERVDSGSRLTIERRAQDVLLTRLPWGCGVIALPWLNERIFVHWLE